MKVKTNVKAGGKRFPSIANWLIDSVRIIAFASFMVLAVAFGAPQNVRAQVTVPVGPQAGQDVTIAWCHPSIGVLEVSIVNNTGTWVDFIAGAYEGYSGYTFYERWIRIGPSDGIGYDAVRHLSPGSGSWAPLVYYRTWDGYQWSSFSYYWVPIYGGGWCSM